MANQIVTHTLRYNELAKIFVPFREVFGKEFPKELKEEMHEIIYQVTQMEGADLNFDLQESISTLNYLYHFFGTDAMQQIANITNDKYDELKRKK